MIVAYISGTRADYGLIKSTLSEISKNNDLFIVATGMHLMEDFGHTIDEVKKDGFSVYEVDSVFVDDDKSSMATFIGDFIVKLTTLFKNKKPDIILVMGDRGEMLAGAIVGQYLGIPVAHIHGGDLSSTVDGVARHAISKLSDFHFVASSESGDHVTAMGCKNVFVVGAPGLDDISSVKNFSKSELGSNLGIKLGRFAIILMHPDGNGDYGAHISNIIDAVLSEGLQVIMIYSNADAGGRQINKVINSYNGFPDIKIFKSIHRKDFLGLMKFASLMIGNSSSGIIESSSFFLPVINIGSRQNGRQRACNVLDCGYDKDDISNVIGIVLRNDIFRNNLMNCKNPYDSGGAGIKIASLLNHLMGGI